MCVNYNYSREKDQAMRKGEMLDKMLMIATKAHHGQFDKGGNPYILHPLKVMHYLKTEDEELMCIALGHDVIEDTRQTYNDVKKATSEMVAEIVYALTNEKGKTRKDRANTKYYDGIKDCEFATFVTLVASAICLSVAFLSLFLSSAIHILILTTESLSIKLPRPPIWRIC